MDDLTYRHVRAFLDDRTKAQAEVIVAWGDQYFDAWAWMQRARWVFAVQYGYAYCIVDAVLGGRALHRDQELIAQWENVLTQHGDIDRYVLAQSQQAPEQIDVAIDHYWKHLV